MSKPKRKNGRPRPVRVPSKPAAGLEAELTAQPRQLSDERSFAGGDAGLSVETEDLGAHFLSEATEQGERRTRATTDVELSLVSGPESDAVQTPPNFEYENTVWEQTVDLTLQTSGSADQLRASSLIDDEPEPGAARERASESSIRESSLFDREDDDESISPAEPREATQRQPRQRPRALRPRQPGGSRPAAARRAEQLRRWLLAPLRPLLLRFAAALRRLAEH